MWYPRRMPGLKPEQIKALYAQFQAPITALDCGEKCAPYNERGVPFCCDTRHAIPTAYQAEWDYLRAGTDLWHLWESGDEHETQRIRAELPAGQVLIECKGHHACQRDFRAITCRAFPFYPYVSAEGEFIGLSYYWEYADRCWVINNLTVVTDEYRCEFIQAYDTLFELHPEEKENFRNHSQYARKVFEKKRRSIPILHRDGELYALSWRSERLRRLSAQRLPKFGPYALAAQLPFPNEV